MMTRSVGLALKRLADILISVMLLVLLAPVFLAVAMAIRLAGPGLVIFRQRRPGLHGKPFTVLKFRTMTDARDAEGRLLPDAQRLTRLGRFLRSSSLDELPQLWNVLKGEMSLIGPRPLLIRYLPYYSQRERKRFDMRPGMTGLAQVRGRNNLSWDERLALDTEYVERYSLALDLEILLLTPLKVLRRENVQVAPSATTLSLDEEREHAKS